MAHSPDDRFQQLREEILQALQAGRLVSRQELISKHPDLVNRINQLFAEIDVTPPVNDSTAATLLPVTDAVANAPDELATLPPAPDAASASLAQDAATVFPPAEFAPTGVRRNGAATEPDLTSASAGSSGTRVRYFGDYELISEIARGGMGVVYKARQVNLNRIVALKMILSGQLASDEDIRRFHTEAESAAHLDHPGIVPIYEIGDHEGQHYFSMGFVDGKSLADRVKDGPLPPQEAASLTRKISEAIAYAHEKGVIHRDLKPANVLLDAGGEPKVTDFGLARKLEQDSGLTRTGAVMGTPSYMPPEQAAGETANVGPLADVYSLGAMLYCLLTGRPPFQAANPLDTLLQVMEREPIAPTELAPTIPKDLETICLKCLQKDRLKRYESANDLAADIGRWERGEPIRARAVTRTERVYRWIKRNRIVSALLAATAVGLVLATGFGIQARIAQEATESTLARSNYFLAVARWDANRVPEAKSILYRIPPKYRRFEWYLVHSKFQCAYTTMTCYGHQEYVSSVAFSPDGTRIVSGSGDLTLKLWDSTTGQELRTLKGHLDCVSSVAFNPDGTRIISGSNDTTVKLWDASTGKELRTFQGHLGYVSSVAFSPDGTRIVSGGEDHTVKLWDVSTGQELRTLKGHTSSISSVAFSPDGTRIISGSYDTTVKLWDASTGKELLTLRGHAAPVTSVAFSPDGTRIISGSDDTTVKLWDAVTGQELLTPRGHAAPVTSVAFSPDGTRFVSGGGDATVKLWDALTGQELRTLKGHAKAVTSVCFSPDGTRIVSGGADDTVKLWDAVTDHETPTLQGHMTTVSSGSFSPDGTRIVSGSRDGTVKLWDAMTGQEVHTLKGHTKAVFSVSFSRDGTRIISGSHDTTVKLWDAVTGQELLTLRGHAAPVTSVAFSPDGTRIVSGGGDATVKLWDASSGQELLTCRSRDVVCSVAFSPDGTRIVAVETLNTVKVWDASTGQELRAIELQAEYNYGEAFAFSNDGARMVSAHYDNTVRLWDAFTGEELLTLRGHAAPVTSVAFSADGTRIVSGSLDSTAKLWDAVTGEELSTLKEHTNAVSSVAFSADGTQIVTGSYDKTLKLWNTSTDPELRTLQGDTDRVTAITVSPDGSRICSGIDDGTLKVWDASSLQELRTVKGHTSSVTSVAFSPDSTRIVSGNDDGTLKVWDASALQKLRTLESYTGKSVTGVAFSPDGTRIVAFYGRDDSAYRRDDFAILWDIRNGERLDGGNRPKFDGFTEQSFVKSPDARWLPFCAADSVLLVDLGFKSTPQERLRRELLARPKPGWHLQQSSAAQTTENWYAAVFHTAWSLKLNPTDGWAYDDLHEAYRTLLAANHGSAQPIPAIVGEVLTLPRGAEPPQLTDDSARSLNSELWNLVQTPVADTSGQVSALNQQRMEHVCSRYPLAAYIKTLGVLQYRLGQSDRAIQTLRKSLETSAGETDPPGSDPAALAFLALSHHQLDKTDQAAQLRQQLNETMHQEKWVLKPELQTILVEVQSVFDGVHSVWTEGMSDDFNREAGFEGLSQHRWRFGFGANDSAPFAISGENPHAGTTCLSIQCGGTTVMANQSVAVLPQSRYRLTGWIRTQDVASTESEPNAADGVSIGIRPVDESAAWTSENGSVPVVGTTEWTQVTFEFQTGDATTMQIGCRSRNCTGTVWFDDLHLEKLE